MPKSKKRQQSSNQKKIKVPKPEIVVVESPQSNDDEMSSNEQLEAQVDNQNVYQSDPSLSLSEQDENNDNAPIESPAEEEVVQEEEVFDEQVVEEEQVSEQVVGKEVEKEEVITRASRAPSDDSISDYEKESERKSNARKAEKKERKIKKAAAAKKATRPVQAAGSSDVSKETSDRVQDNSTSVKSSRKKDSNSDASSKKKEPVLISPSADQESPSNSLKLKKKATKAQKSPIKVVIEPVENEEQDVVSDRIEEIPTAEARKMTRKKTEHDTEQDSTNGYQKPPTQNTRKASSPALFESGLKGEVPLSRRSSQMLPESGLKIEIPMIRRSSQMLPETLAVNLNTKALVRQSNLIQTPLNTEQRLKLTEHFKKQNSIAIATATSGIFDTELSPLRAHTKADQSEMKHTLRKEKEKKPKKRRCQNGVSAMIWLFMTLIIVLVSVLAMQLGQIDRLILPYDSLGNQCGIDIVGSANLLYFNLSNPATYKRCVVSCPLKNQTVCMYNVTLSTDAVVAETQYSNGTCVYMSSNSINGLHRCFPSDLENTNILNAQQVAATIALTSDLKTESYMATFFNILISCVIVIGICVGTSIVLGCFWYYLVLFFGPVLLLCSIAIIFMLLWAVTGYLIYLYISVTQISLELSSDVVSSSFRNNPAIVLGGLIISSSISLGFTALLISMRNSFQLASKIMKEAANHLLHVYLIPLLMTVQSLLAVAVTAYTILVYGLLYTLKVPEKATLLGYDLRWFCKIIILDGPVIGYLSLLCIWYVWTMLIIYAVGRATVFKAVGKVYWSGLGTHKSKVWIGVNALEIMKTHFGTIAFGVVVIPIVFVMNIIEYSLRPSFAKASNILQEQFVAIASNSRAERVRGWFRHVLRDVNSRAFIQVSLGGGDFCKASRVATEVFQEELNGITQMGRIITWICVMSVALATTLVGVILSNTTTSSASITSALPILTVIAAASLYIASIFLQSFSAAIDTMLYCYCEDLETNNGTTLPYAMPSTLRLFIDQHKQTQEGSRELV